jgi:hypothetical protein
MLRRCVFKLAGIALLLLGSARPVRAQTPRSGPDPARPIAPFTRNALGIELAGGALTEAWNSNGSHEWIGEGTFSVNWTFAKSMMLVAQFHAAGISQASPRAAFLNGFVTAVRFRVFTREDWTMFVEIGPGVSWSDTATPPRGTRFNYLLVANTGFMYRLTPQVHAVMNARLLHLSNASLKGRDHNPDIEALGATFGIYFRF